MNLSIRLPKTAINLTLIRGGTAALAGQWSGHLHPDRVAGLSRGMKNGAEPSEKGKHIKVNVG